MKNRISQRGTAIIVALFVTALVAAAAIAMIDRLRTDIHRTELLLNNIQANQSAQGSIYWAMDLLTNNWKQQQPGKVIDRTPISSPTNEVNNAKISSVIHDAQGKFNLNNLSDVQFQQMFARLVHIVQPNIDPAAAQTITLNVVNWITPGVSNSQIEKYYTKRHPSYRAPHRPMVSISELRMVKDMTPALFAALEPYVTALPEKTLININSAPIPIIMSFSPSITLEMAKSLNEFRQQTPFANLSALSNFPVVKNSPIAQNNLTVNSSYFLVQTDVVLRDQHTVLYTLLMRLLKNAQPTVIILWQSKGTL